VVYDISSKPPSTNFMGIEMSRLNNKIKKASYLESEGNILHAIQVTII